MNNNDWPKCFLYAEEDFVALRNVPHTATYMYGKLTDLIIRIEAS